MTQWSVSEQEGETLKTSSWSSVRVRSTLDNIGVKPSSGSYRMSKDTPQICCCHTRSVSAMSCVLSPYPCAINSLSKCVLLLLSSKHLCSLSVRPETHPPLPACATRRLWPICSESPERQPARSGSPEEEDAKLVGFGPHASMTYTGTCTSLLRGRG